MIVVRSLTKSLAHPRPARRLRARGAAAGRAAARGAPAVVGQRAGAGRARRRRRPPRRAGRDRRARRARARGPGRSASRPSRRCAPGPAPRTSASSRSPTARASVAAPARRAASRSARRRRSRASAPATCASPRARRAENARLVDGAGGGGRRREPSPSSWASAPTAGPGSASRRARRSRAADADRRPARQLALLPDDAGGRAAAWPSPLAPLLDELAADRRQATSACWPAATRCSTASAPRSPAGSARARSRVLPHPSSFALACARLGWPEDEVEVVSAVGRPLEVLRPAAAARPPAARARRRRRRRRRGRGAAARARLRRRAGLVVLEQLGGAGRADRRAHRRRPGASAASDPLHAVALDCRAGAGAPLLPRTPGLPDDAYEHDGQLTKRERPRAHARRARPGARASCCGTSAPAPASIGIEWMRADPACRAVAVERRADRAERIAAQRAAPRRPRTCEVRRGPAPGGAGRACRRPTRSSSAAASTAPGLLERCWEALRPGGRLVANAVTLEGEARAAPAGTPRTAATCPARGRATPSPSAASPAGGRRMPGASGR